MDCLKQPDEIHDRIRLPRARVDASVHELIHCFDRSVDDARDAKRVTRRRPSR